MTSSETNKELLNLEQQPCSPESRLFICNNTSLLRKSKKMEVNEHKHEGRPTDTTCPESHVLGKVKNFLHEIAQANKQLETKMQENPLVNYDIEELRGDETEIIEMDLLLGVAELQTPEALEAAEVAVDGQQREIIPCGRYIDSDDESCSDDSEDGNSDDKNSDKSSRGQGPRPNSAQPSAGKKRKKGSKIVVLN